MKQIEIIKLAKSYDKENMVLQDIDLEVEEGEFVVLVGPSGCGKSTLLRMISGLEEITDGVLKISGEVANHKLPKDRDLSMVFQNYALYPHMTVRSNILFGLDVKKISKKEQDKRLQETAELVGLTEFLDRKPGQLSGGQRQRVALARSICSQAPICLMDEPLSNLDAKLRSTMRTEIRRIQKKLNLTMIYVTHDQVEAMTMGDRIMVLNDGYVQQTGTPIDIYNNPENVFVATFMGSPQMNISRASLSGKRLTLNDAVSIELTAQQALELPKGNEFFVGIRPNLIKLASSGSKNGVFMNVVNVELLGDETQIVLEVKNITFTLKWQGQWDIEPGKEIFVELNPDNMHFFDINTEKNIRPAKLQVDADADEIIKSNVM